MILSVSFSPANVFATTTVEGSTTSRSTESSLPHGEFSLASLEFEKPPIQIEVVESPHSIATKQAESEDAKKRKVAVQAKQTVKPTVTSTPAPAVEQETSGHIFYKGFCAWYVANHWPVTWGGNAKQWVGHARAQGYRVDMTPEVGAIIATYEGGGYGHVGLVTGVSADGLLITVTEMNFAGWNKVSSRTIPATYPLVQGIIHRK